VPKAPAAPAVPAAVLLAASGLPRGEVRALLAHALDVRRERLIAHPETAVPAAAAATFRALAQRRAAGEPLPYLLGTQEFYGRPFAVNADVLIPRPDTETLIDVALACLASHPAPRVLELGTGSGCIAITLQCERSRACVVATDVSEPALAVARGNAQRLGATVEFRHGDWWAAVPATERYDLVVSNPPYVAAGDPHLADLGHEPSLALTDGDDGLRCLAAIAQIAPTRLVPGGWLVLEHGYDQGPAVAALLASAGLLDVSTASDAAGRPRVTRGQAPGRPGGRAAA